MPNPLGRALRNRRAGHHTLAWANPALQAPENFTLSSPVFHHGSPIPERHRGRIFAANVSPELSWTEPPEGGPLRRLGWAGPAPIPSHGPHSYVFQLFALDRPIALPQKFTLAAAADAMTGHIMGRARLDGTYEIR